MAETVQLNIQLNDNGVLGRLQEIDQVLNRIKKTKEIKFESKTVTTAATSAKKLADEMERAAAAAKRFKDEGPAGGFEGAGKAAGEASRNVESFRNGIGSVLVSMAGFRLASAAINAVVNSIGDAFKEMKAVDAEMVNVRKVTGMSAREMEKLEQRAYSLASQYGRSASEVMEAATVYARAGYTDQIEDLAELSLLLQNAGDLEADQAATFLIATDAAFKLGGSYTDLMAVIDGLDNITNKNATDMEKLTEGMTVAGSVFAQSGESIQTFASLLGTVTAATQRSGSEVARGLRTIWMNLRQIRGETIDGQLVDEKSWADAAKTLREYAGIETIVNGQLRAGSDIMAELHEKWVTTLKDNTIAKERITEALAGKRQSNILYALLDNYDMFEKMIGEYENAAGTAAAENAAYMDSWAARAEVLKSSWTEFVNNLVNTDAVKDFITGTSELLRQINEAFNPVNAASGEVARLAGIYERLYGESGEYAELKSRAEELTEIEALRLDYLEKQLAVYKQQIKEAKEGEYNAWQKQYGTGKKSLEWDNIAGTIVTKSQDLIDLENVRISLKLLNDQFAKDGDLAAYNAGLDALREKYASLRSDLQTWEKEGFGSELSSEQKQLLDVFTVLDGQVADTTNATKTYTAAMAAYFLTFGKDAQTAVADAQTAAANFAQAQQEAQASVQATAAAVGNVTTAANSVPENTTANVDVDTNGAEEKLGGILGLLQQIGNFFMGDVPGLTGGGGEPSVYTYSGYASGTASAPGGPALVNERGPEVISANGLAWIAGGGKPTVTMLPRGATVLTAQQSRPLLSGGAIPAYETGTGTGSGQEVREILGLDEDKSAEEEAVLEQAKKDGAGSGAVVSAIAGILGRYGRGGGGYTEPTGPLPPNFKALEQELSDALKKLGMQAELAENEGDLVRVLQIYGEAQDLIAELLEKYRANGYAEDSEEVLRLANLGYDYASKQLGTYDDLQKQLIDALNALNETTEDANALQEKQEAVDKAREALKNAERQRTVRIFNPVTGQWEWVANAADVEKAREALAKAEKDLQDEQFSQTLDAIKNAKPGELADMTLAPAVLDKLFTASPELQSAFLNALGAATGGADYMASDEAKTAWNQGNIGTQYNFNGITLTEAQASGMTIKELIGLLQGLKIM